MSLYKLVNWKNHVVEYPLRRLIEDNGDGTYTVSPSPGEIIQHGTKQSAENFGHMDEGILDNALFCRIMLNLDVLGGSFGESGVSSDIYEADAEDIQEIVGMIQDPFDPKDSDCGCGFEEADDEDIRDLFN